MTTKRFGDKNSVFLAQYLGLKIKNANFAFIKPETMDKGKLIIISAPSGCGKSTIINSILDAEKFDLSFSVSATNRAPRPGEEDGVHYRFLTTEQFNDAVDRGEFVEWEEVYPGRYYGTMRSEIDRLIDAGHNVLLDIDVKGALNVKEIYGDRSLTLFIEPPSIEELRRRLESRGTENAESIDTRISRAEFEMTFSPKFDKVVVNDKLDKAIAETTEIFREFLQK